MPLEPCTRPKNGEMRWSDHGSVTTLTCQKSVPENTPLVSFSVLGSNALGATISYQWQRSDDAGATWTNVAGATSTTFSFATVAGDDIVNAAESARVMRFIPSSELNAIDPMWIPFAIAENEQLAPPARTVPTLQDRKSVV